MDLSYVCMNTSESCMCPKVYLCEVMRGEHFREGGRVSGGAKLSKLGRVSHTNILRKTIKMPLYLYLLFPDATLFLAPIEFMPPF